MSEEFGLEEAYGLETSEDNRRLYKSWAKTYDDDFVVSHGYTYPQAVADVFTRHASEADLPLLDVGCGTGLVGAGLAGNRGEYFAGQIIGIDISPEMLALAAVRTDESGDPVYAELIEADLTKALELSSGRFGAAVSSGTFTHGHVGVDALDELLRVVRSGGLLCLGINSEHFQSGGFENWFDEAAERADIVSLTIEVVPIYADPHDQHDHTNDTAHVAVFRRAGA